MPLKRRRLMEVILIMGLMLLSVFVISSLKGLLVILPIVYFLVEQRIREKTKSYWRPMISGFLTGVRAAWGWILLAAIGSQAVFASLFHMFSPETIAHIQERLPASGQWSAPLVIAILIAPLGEEITFRGLIQERLGWFLPAWAAVGLASLLFALMHLSSGPAEVVFWDLFSVFADSVLYGVIYAKTGNLLVSYVAHLLADGVGMLLMTAL